MAGLQKLKIFDDKRHNPAVGECYGRTPLGRLLVVGMSHYGDEGDVKWPGFTHMIVGEVIGEKRKIPYFAKIAGIFENAEGDPYSPPEFFSEIAFYNFLPDVFRVRERVTREQWLNANAQRFFFRVLDELRPERVLVTGEQLWSVLPSKDLDHNGVSRDTGDLSGPDVLFSCEEPKCCWYRVGDSDRCLVGAITHPSSAKFSKTRSEIADWVARFMMWNES